MLIVILSKYIFNIIIILMLIINNVLCLRTGICKHPIGCAINGINNAAPEIEFGYKCCNIFGNNCSEVTAGTFTDYDEKVLSNWCIKQGGNLVLGIDLNDCKRDSC